MEVLLIRVLLIPWDGRSGWAIPRRETPRDGGMERSR
jgi:hypothetical protein